MQFPIPTPWSLRFPSTPLPSSSDPEYWFPVPDFPGYEISSHGRAYSYWKKVSRGKGNGKGSNSIITSSPVLLIPPLHPRTGRLRYGLRRDGRKTTFQVAHWMLRSFVSPWPGPGWDCCHNDGNPQNNCLRTNLRWDTHSRNIIDAVLHGTHHKARLSPSDVLEIRSRRTAGESQQSIADRFSVTRRTVSHIDAGDSWTWLS